ncbi:hypothetical protein DXT68_11170 [Microbacterium foliorum]|uniref:Uncharacterized protein n=1 Tax=Microbacterium foliorum TaxID=104336 RepID=A0A0F0KV47_9MICO|nr:hypothetical protein [Microbacterium foliorum]AXL12639.1 hypothetical protein DXT68_11170 [Microbacterium foliorum]KJL23126.1 hypothetical protein RN50_01064 [Microbacterium foliorum]CAH0152765.1 hypothetical protein SRABI03_00801 [Microbacterium foliorum]CAH0177370.1 hypothetical protein SRABI44_01360 [Microbacterium foliorum]
MNLNTSRPSARPRSSSAPLLRTWLPGILIVVSVVLALVTSIDPWIIGACTGVLIVIVLAVDRAIRRRRRTLDLADAPTR